MTVHKMTAVDGKGTPVDRSAELCEAIKAVIYDMAEGLPVATVIGALEIAKHEILKDQEE